MLKQYSLIQGYQEFRKENLPPSSEHGCSMYLQISVRIYQNVRGHTQTNGDLEHLLLHCEVYISNTDNVIGKAKCQEKRLKNMCMWYSIVI